MANWRGCAVNIFAPKPERSLSKFRRSGSAGAGAVRATDSVPRRARARFRAPPRQGLGSVASTTADRSGERARQDRAVTCREPASRCPALLDADRNGPLEKTESIRALNEEQKGSRARPSSLIDAAVHLRHHSRRISTPAQGGDSGRPGGEKKGGRHEVGRRRRRGAAEQRRGWPAEGRQAKGAARQAAHDCAGESAAGFRFHRLLARPHLHPSPDR